MGLRKKSNNGDIPGLKPTVYKVYGIYNKKLHKLVYLHMDEEQVEMEFDMLNYDDDHVIVETDIMFH